MADASPDRPWLGSHLTLRTCRTRQRNMTRNKGVTPHPTPRTCGQQKGQKGSRRPDTADHMTNGENRLGRVD